MKEREAHTMTASNFICVTCGTQYPATDTPPAECPVCQDPRQYVGHQGQQWTTLDALRIDHHNTFSEVEPGIIGIVSEPRFAIGQRAMLVISPHGNTLWDCISLLDIETIARINDLGGIKRIAISHPHFYTTMVEWSRTFDAPIYIHESERADVRRPEAPIHFWQGDTFDLGGGQTLIRCGGHFTGSQALHLSQTHDGKGALLTGDTMYVVADRRYVTFMRSYPNMIPLSAAKVQRIVDAVAPFAFERLHGHTSGLDIEHDARTCVLNSAQRYMQALATAV
jgi:glyoxylase-like metal-dependent hydrolase (beta-lactamase superfamily II)